VRFDTQFENAGDCLINRELVRLLVARGSVCLDFSACPKGFADQIIAGLPQEVSRKWIPWPFYFAMLGARLRGRRCYWFLMPGGISGQRRVGALSIWLRDLPLPITAALGVRICQVGASFGGLSGEQLATWRRRRRWLHRLCPRDSISADYLHAHGIHHDGCIPDLAFNLFAFNGRTIAPPPGKGMPPVGSLSFRTDLYPRQARDVANVLSDLYRCNGDGGMVWRPIVQVARDRAGMDTLQRQLQSQGMIVDPPVDLHGDVEACLRFYQGLSLVISNRLHVLLMAASQGGRILALTNGPGGAKLEGILRDLGLHGAIIHNGNDCSNHTGSNRICNHNHIGMRLDGAGQCRALHRAFDKLLEIA
jgi:polysaccharide pyruvyl transferase WcaK-like protein